GCGHIIRAWGPVCCNISKFELNFAVADLLSGHRVNANPKPCTILKKPACPALTAGKERFINMNLVFISLPFWRHIRILVFQMVPASACTFGVTKSKFKAKSVSAVICTAILKRYYNVLSPDCLYWQRVYIARYPPVI